MIILSDWDRIGDSYRMVLKMGTNDSIDDLPSANRPMNPEFFAVSKEYGIPADGSVVTINNGDTLIYKGGEWAPAFLPMPVKGDLIMLDGKQYRVLKTNDTVAELYGLYTIPEQQFATGGTAAYFGSPIDTYLNETFYSELSASIQNAIVENQIAEDSFGIDNGTEKYSYFYKNSSKIQKLNKLEDVYAFGEKKEEGVRKCYMISLSTILDYCNATLNMDENTTSFTEEIMDQLTPPSAETLFFNTETNSYSAHAPVCLAYIKSTKEFESTLIDTVGVACPAFQIDLSKVEWTWA